MGALLDKLEGDPRARRLALASVLVVYVAAVLLVSKPRLVGDEWRYLWYAENLLDGYYSPPEFVFLWNGPGYPLLLTPFVFLGLPLLSIKIFNVALLGVALVLFFRFVESLSDVRAAVVATAALAAYLPVVAFAGFVYTEVLSFTLVVSFVHGLWAYTTTGRPSRAWQPGLSLGWLGLTKIVFGPLLFLGLVASLGWVFVKRRNLSIQVTKVFALGALVTVPYLAYSYALTGRVFYWGSGGGSTLYWMSNPHPGQLGDWFHEGEVRKDPRLEAAHWKFISEIGKLEGRSRPNDQDKDALARYLSDLSSVEADLAFRRRAYDNIEQHPGAYLKNWVCNVSRLVLDYPYTVRRFTPLNALQGLFNVLALVLAVVGFATLVRARSKRLPLARTLLLLLVAYLGMLSLVSASGRFFVPVAPLALSLAALGFARDRRGSSSTEAS